jgi:hypothetical protein
MGDGCLSAALRLKVLLRSSAKDEASSDEAELGRREVGNKKSSGFKHRASNQKNNQE